MKNKRFLKLISSVGLTLNLLFVFSLIATIAINLWLSNVPELFAAGDKIGKLVDALCLSFLASYVFYFVVVHLREFKNREIVYRRAVTLAQNIVGQGSALIDAMREYCNFEKTETWPDKEELVSMCEKIYIHAEAPIWLGFREKGNWIDYLNHFRTHSHKRVEQIFLMIPFLEPSFIRTILEVEESHYFQSLELVESTQAAPQNIMWLVNEIDAYINALIYLHTYIEENLTDYKTYNPQIKRKQ